MAAPDRVYRYFTNLISKTPNGTASGYKQFIRCAKPLSSYISSGSNTYALKEQDFCNKFKVDGILWVKNPDVPKTALDNPNTVTIDGNITIVDPDLGDPDRDGIIAYVYPSGANAAFHDMDTTVSSPRTDPTATDYTTRAWTRASKFRYKKYNDSEAAIILNDGGLNRKGEATVNTESLSTCDFTNGLINFRGSVIAPLYNKIYTYGLYYKWQSYSPIGNNQTSNLNNATNPNNTERKVAINAVVPRGTTKIFGSNNPLPVPLNPADYIYQGQGEGTTIKAHDFVFFRPYVITEEGEYSYPYNSSWVVTVDSIKFKVKPYNKQNLVSFQNAMDENASGPASNVFTEEWAESHISLDNEENENDYGTMYLERHLPQNAESIVISAYNDDAAIGGNDRFYYGKATGQSGVDGTMYYTGPLYEDNQIMYFKWIELTYGPIQVSGGQQLGKYISRVGVYPPKIKSLDLYSLRCTSSSIPNVSARMLIVNYYNEDLQEVMDGITETHTFVASHPWVTPTGSNDTDVISCIQEFVSNFIADKDDSGNQNHADKMDIFCEPQTAFGEASIDNLNVEIALTNIYKNTNQTGSGIDGVSAQTIREERRYITADDSHLFTGAVFAPRIIQDTHGNDAVSGFVIHVYVLGKDMNVTYPDASSTEFTYGYQFYKDRQSN